MPRRHRFALLLATAAVALLASSGIALAQTGAIAGRLTDVRTDVPLEDISVRAYLYDLDTVADASPAAETTTNADGEYALSGIAPGKYVIVFADRSDTYRDMCYTAWGVPPLYAPAWTVSADSTLTADARMYSIEYVNAHRAGRWSGTNVYQTAIAAARAGFGGTNAPNTVVIAAAKAWPDALSASTLAGYHKAPVLFTPSSSLPSGLLDYVAEAGATRAIIVGGRASVSDHVYAQLQAAGLTVTRIGGSDRYVTSANVVRYLISKTPDLNDTPFVVSGENWADAVSVAPLAYSELRPVLLVKPTSAPSPTAAIVKKLQTKMVVVAGGPASVGSGALGGLAVARPGLTYLRLGGNTRYDVCAKVASASTPFDYAALASGTSFGEALVGGIVAGRLGGALLLTPPTSLNSAAAKVISKNRLYLWEIDAFGRKDQLAPSVLSAARSRIGTGTLDLDAEVQKLDAR